MPKTKEERPLLLWQDDGQPGETILQFEERVGELGKHIHIFRQDCKKKSCDSNWGAVICDSHEDRVGEAWCLKCGEDLPS